jgi:hypothetical protein
MNLSSDGTFTFSRHIYDDTILTGSYLVQNDTLTLQGGILPLYNRRNRRYNKPVPGAMENIAPGTMDLKL